MRPGGSNERDAVFRKAAVERLTSPEEFGETLSIIQPLDWLVLSAIGLLVAGAVAWGIAGRVAITIPAEGVVMGRPPAGEPRRVVVLVAEAAAGKVRPGLEVRLTPTFLPRQAFGRVQGQVVRADPSPLSEPGLRELLLHDARAQDLFARGLRIRVEVELLAEPRALTEGTEVAGEIVLRRERPIAHLLPWVRPAGS